MILRWCIVFILLNTVPCVFAQKSVRVVVLGGGNLEFVFNSIKDYKDGIEAPYVNYTTIGITIADTVGAADYLRWELSVEAQDNDGLGDIRGSIAANNIPFSAVELRATLNAGCVSCNFLGSPWRDLPANGAPVVLVDGSSAAGWPPDQIPDVVPPAVNLSYVTDWIDISYRCGVGAAKSLFGKPADFYSDGIIFTIDMYDF